MKRCPNCKAVSPNDETTCGICGESIADAPFESTDQIDREQIDDARIEEQTEDKAIRQVEMKRLKVKIAVTLAGVLTGIGFLALGLSLFGQNRDQYGVYALIAGLAVLFMTLVPAGSVSPRWRWTFGWCR